MPLVQRTDLGDEHQITSTVSSTSQIHIFIYYFNPIMALFSSSGESSASARTSELLCALPFHLKRASLPFFCLNGINPESEQSTTKQTRH